MASPPAKRQRRSIVVNSDAEDSAAESQLSNASLNVTTRSLSLRNSAQSRKQQHDTKPKATNTTNTKTSKSKPTAGKKSRITKNATIYSFFNNATQNSQRTSRPNTPQPQGPDRKSEEVVDDISSDDAVSHNSLLLAPSADANGKADTQVVRNGKAIAPLAGGSGKHVSKPLAIVVSSQESTSNNSLESGPWADIYPPESLEELAVHKRKVSDVHRWLDNVMKGREHKVSCLYCHRVSADLA